MPRRKLTEEEKNAMQQARVRTAEERAEAKDALTNPQFTNAKFWKTVDETVLNSVHAAIQKAKEAGKKARITELEAELATLKEELQQ